MLSDDTATATPTHQPPGSPAPGVVLRARCLTKGFASRAASIRRPLAASPDVLAADGPAHLRALTRTVTA